MGEGNPTPRRGISRKYAGSAVACGLFRFIGRPMASGFAGYFGLVDWEAPCTGDLLPENMRMIALPSLFLEPDGPVSIRKLPNASMCANARPFVGPDSVLSPSLPPISLGK